ncbi:sorbosone dehydrogenase family protein [Streptomyces sp. YIM 98790]|uniref:PQQ-dependent sugar dehydrogenase n=1 Tax=Streptomyces sp. YIM 98790 TaxID=2689077 RepID=UPI001409B2A4|nr:PQQ-dependent sugar dehydrogenase [Streptomyces sp. YIM 98790]
MARTQAYRRIRRAAVALLLGAAVTACAGGPAADRASDTPTSPPTETTTTPPPTDAPSPGSGTEGDSPAREPTEHDLEPAAPTGTATVTEEHPLTGITDPWGLAVLPASGDLLVGSRTTGVIYRVAKDTGDITEVGTAASHAVGEGGLLGLAAADKTYFFAYYTTTSESRVVRSAYQTDKPEGQQMETSGRLTGLPWGDTRVGGALLLTPDGSLYAGVGDLGGTSSTAQSDSPAGDILKAPEVLGASWNPQLPDMEVYSGAQGSVEGLALDANGRVWAVGRGEEDSAVLALADSDQPLHVWTDGAAPTGLAYTPQRCLWVSTADGILWRVPLDGTELVIDPRPAVDVVNGPPRELSGRYSSLRSPTSAGEDALWVLATGDEGAALLKLSVS